MARGLVDGFAGALAGKKYLIHDRGSVFTEKFRTGNATCLDDGYGYFGIQKSGSLSRVSFGT